MWIENNVATTEKKEKYSVASSYFHIRTTHLTHLGFMKKTEVRINWIVSSDWVDYCNPFAYLNWICSWRCGICL